MYRTLLAFDFGTKSIGVAIGQNITGTAQPLNALKAKNGIPNWNLIEYLLKEWQPKEVVVGLPLKINGADQFFTKRTRKFANEIHMRFNIEVKLHDERLSTVEARHKMFKNRDFLALRNKGKIDSASAVIILESYFNYGSPNL